MSAPIISKVFKEQDGFLFFLYLIILFWAPIPLGSNRPWSAMLLTFLSSALCLVWLLLYLNNKVTINFSVYKARWALLSLACFQVWVFFQILPLPASWLAVFSSTTYSHYQHTVYSDFMPINLSIDSGLKACLLGFGISFSFLLALLLVNTKERKQLFLMTIVVSGVAQAIVGLLMVFVDYELIHNVKSWLYLHKSTASGTFVNSNHFAAYLNISLAIGLGLLIGQFSSQNYVNWQAYLRSVIATLLSSKMRLRIYLMIMVIALLVSQSRMGNFAFFAALSLTSLLFLFSRKKFNLKLLLLFLSLMVVDTFLVGTWFGFDKVIQEVEKTDLSNNERTEINENSRQLISQYAFVGAGAGAYKYIEPASNVSPSVALTEHAHNDYYEFFIETGVLGMTCLLLFLYSVVRALKQKYKSRDNKGEAFGISMLLIYLSLHSSVDFNLQIPAFSFTLLACLAMVFVDNCYTNKVKDKLNNHNKAAFIGSSHV